MAIRIAICDDDEKQLQALNALLSNWARSQGVAARVLLFPSAEAFLFAYEEDSAYDILVLDVEMKEISGIELARRVRKEDGRVEILFITSHFEFISEGYEVDALHYLTKPVARDKLYAVLSRALDRLCAEPPSVIISCEGKTVKLHEPDILYVEAFLHYISIHTPEQEYRIKESISSFEKRLTDDFFRIHRSYLVSLKKVIRITHREVALEDGTLLPLARGKYDAVNRAFIERN
ncbi:MAG: response regulator transcription factor [Lachnospiraceae bacterium]|nr:response regulator transcription factor [Lachnospiraceae bacterium]